MWIFYVFVLSCVCYVVVRVCLYVLLVTCWERADLLTLVCGVCCEFVTFPLVSWVSCGIWLYRFLIFAPLLTFIKWIKITKHIFTINVNLNYPDALFMNAMKCEIMLIEVPNVNWICLGYTQQLHSKPLKDLGNQDLIEVSSYVQGIIADGWIMSSQESK